MSPVSRTFITIPIHGRAGKNTGRVSHKKKHFGGRKREGEPAYLPKASRSDKRKRSKGEDYQGPESERDVDCKNAQVCPPGEGKPPSNNR